MKILGIDPGLITTGYGLIEQTGNQVKLIEAGYISTSSNTAIESRLIKIHSSLKEILNTHKPKFLVLEKLYAHYRHPTTACLLGHVRGTICLLAAQEKINLIEYGATRIKKSIVGRGNATKSQVQNMVQMTLNLRSQKIKDDVTDAIAIALAHVNISRVSL